MRAASMVLVMCAVLTACGGSSSDPEETSPPSSPTSESPESDSTTTSVVDSGPTAGDGSVATGQLMVASRYRFDNKDLPVFPSPDGRLYLDVDGCVVPIVEDRQRACPDGDRWVASAGWAPDGSFVVHDSATRGGGGSDIHAVFIDDPAGDRDGSAPQAEFVNLTEDDGGEESNIDVMPLVIGGEIRFLRFSVPPGRSEVLEIVTIDRGGAVVSAAETTLTPDDLIGQLAVLVADRHALLGAPGTSDQGQLITVDADGTTLAHPLDGESVVRPYGTAESDALVMTFDAVLEPTSGQIRTFDGSDYGTTGLAVTGRDFDVLYSNGFDPIAAAFAPDGSEIIAAYSNADGTSTTLQIWNEAEATITDIGTIPVRAVHEIRWVSSDQLVVFGEDEILTVQLTT